MSRIHIEGMGVLGSMLARRLAELDVPFTWSDNNDPFSAWRVSTGLAYPDGDPDNQAGLARWHELLPDVPEAKAVPYVFAHKAPPHKGSYPLVADYGILRMAEPKAVALNVPAFVGNTRMDHFEKQLPNTPTDRRTVVVAHTTPGRGDGYLWGWVARVRFDLPDALAADCMDEQPALYAKAHRFNLTYAYPIPGTGQWWAGSVLQMQRKPKKIDNGHLTDLFRDWEKNALDLLGIRNVQLEGLGQGWRPRATLYDSGEAELHADNHWLMPPMATDGVRRGWLVVDDLIERAGWELL